MRTLSSRDDDGFTLIELIIVIVILGILAVTAAPRFIDITSESNAASLQALKGALQSSNRIVHGKAVLEGIQKEPSASLQLSSGDTVSLVYGYIAYNASNPASGGEQLSDALNIRVCHHLASDAACANADWRYDIDPGDIKFYHISIGENPSQGLGDGNEPQCYLQYNLASDEHTPPTYEVFTAEC